MNTEVKLPILSKLVSESTKYGNIPVLTIQHLRPDTYQFFKELKIAGFGPLLISGIEYSTENSVLEQLKKDGYKIKNPKNSELLTTEYWDAFVGTEIKRWNETNQEYMILEDGGYIGTVFHEHRKQDLKTCKGIVEQTANGLWKYEELERSGMLSVPVYTVAKSMLKRTVEAPEVGLAIVKSLEQNLDKLHNSLNHKTILILGFGSIGKEVAKTIKGRNPSKVLIYDSNSTIMMEAKYSGFETTLKEAGLQKADIVIGCTGRKSIMPEEYNSVKDGVILVNASSKRVEFDISWLKENCTNTESNESVLSFEILSKGIRILSKGEPVNFDSNVSVSPETIDVVISEMFVCVQNIMGGGLENKVYAISEEDERRISDLWMDIYQN